MSARLAVALPALLAILALFALPGPLSAATPPDSTVSSTPPADSPPPRPGCTSPESRQFDFWLGDWEVRTPKGTLAGTNRVVAILGGCVIEENWKGSRGMSGTSLNMFDPATGRWHQTWMDDQGTLLLLDGSFQDGKMILTGESPVPGKPGAVAAQRITWSSLPGGNVRQLWESSTDGGKTWTVAFDGAYSRVP